MEKHLTIKDIAPYLPYNVLGISQTGTKFYLSINSNMLGKGIENRGIDNFINDSYKLLLHPLSDLTKEIEHNGEKFVPIEWFEIGDDENNSIEYDYGNIKLIRSLESLSSNNGFVNDINYLPFGVVQKLIEWKFDISNLIEKGLAVAVTDEFNPYK